MDSVYINASGRSSRTPFSPVSWAAQKGVPYESNKVDCGTRTNLDCRMGGREQRQLSERWTP